MNTYSTSSGERLIKSVIDARVRKAKQRKIDTQLLEFGYNFCEKCGVSSGTYLDCSHKVSVKECQESGSSDLAYDVDNLDILCRGCHKERDKLDLKF